MTYTFGMLKSSNDVVLSYWNVASPERAIINDDRKGWPDTEILSNRSFACAEKLEIETNW